MQRFIRLHEANVPYFLSHNFHALQIHGFFNQKIPKSDNHPINMDKSFCTCPTQLGSQLDLIILTSGVIDKMIDYLIDG